MHYCTLLITKELPTDDKINELLEPYREDGFYEKRKDNPKLPYPPFTWDWYRIGGRYSAMIKLDTTYNAKNIEYEWDNFKERNNKLFISSLLNTLKEHIKPAFMYTEDSYYAELGFRDGFIRVDGAKISDIINLNDITGYNLLTENGEFITRCYFHRGELIDDKIYDKQEKEMLEKYKDSFLTILDIHD